MSFSFTVGGTKEQALNSLAGVSVNDDPLGEEAVKLARSAISNDKTEPDSDEHEVRYSFTASGHSADDSLPYLNVQFLVAYGPGNKGRQ